GGLQRALILLRQDPEYAGGGFSFPGNESAEITISVVQNDSPENPKPTEYGLDLPPNTTMVVCEAVSSDTKRTLAGTVRTASETTPGFGMLSRRRLLVKGAKVGAFQAGPGDDFSLAALEAVPNAVQIGTTEGLTELTLKEKDGVTLYPEVDGAIASDLVDGDPNTTEDSVYTLEEGSILGGETALDTPPEMSPMPEAEYLGGADIDVRSTNAKTIGPGHYNSIHLCEDATLILDPGEYYIKGNFEAWERANVQVKGPVKIYLNSVLMTGQEASINLEQDPSKVEIFITGGESSSTYSWLPWSRNMEFEEPWRPEGAPRRGTVGSQSKIFGQVRATDSKFHVSGYIFGDIQADILDVGGGVDGSGTVQYYVGLSEGDGSIIPLDPAGFIYDNIWIVQQ
ncbi:MAG: hypothetical protein WC423_25510, partial [Vulcanimicrobiota bacterium]